MKRPLDQQVGGQHYKGMTIQPVELAYANRYDDCIFSSMKYLMRHREKHGRADLEKGRHFCFLRYDLMKKYGRPPEATNEIPILRMAFANKMKEDDKLIALLLHMWARNKHTATDDEAAAEIAQAFKELADKCYPEGTPK